MIILLLFQGLSMQIDQVHIRREIMISKLYEKINYQSPVKFLNSSYIREYDLSKANISALLYEGYISLDEYNFLYSLDKTEREVYIGKLELKDKKVGEIKAHGIQEAKRMLFELNGLEDLDILEIRNDAVFVINKQLTNTCFDMFDFKLKNSYTSYTFINNRLSLFYAFDQINQVDTIDVKGIRDEKLLLHQNHFIQFICQVFYLLQTDSVEESLKYISSFYEEYIKRELPIEYYRTFDADSVYKINVRNLSYGLQVIEDNYMNRRGLDINFNIYIIRTLYSYLSEIYFNR